MFSTKSPMSFGLKRPCNFSERYLVKNVCRRKMPKCIFKPLERVTSSPETTSPRPNSLLALQEIQQGAKKARRLQDTEPSMEKREKVRALIEAVMKHVSANKTNESAEDSSPNLLMALQEIQQGAEKARSVQDTEPTMPDRENVRSLIKALIASGNNNDEDDNEDDEDDEDDDDEDDEDDEDEDDEDDEDTGDEDTGDEDDEDTGDEGSEDDEDEKGEAGERSDAINGDDTYYNGSCLTCGANAESSPDAIGGKVWGRPDVFHKILQNLLQEHGPLLITKMELY